MINWCKILDGIAWDLDEQDHTIWGHDCSMNIDEVNKAIEKRLKSRNIVVGDEMKEETFEEFKSRLQTKYPQRPLVERKIKKGNKPVIELWSWGKRGDGSTGKIIVGIYYTKSLVQTLCVTYTTTLKNT